jgi:hypothetical protein
MDTRDRPLDIQPPPKSQRIRTATKNNELLRIVLGPGRTEQITRSVLLAGFSSVMVLIAWPAIFYWWRSSSIGEIVVLSIIGLPAIFMGVSSTVFGKEIILIDDRGLHVTWARVWLGMGFP